MSTSEKPLHIDIPVKLAEVKIVFSVGALAFVRPWGLRLPRRPVPRCVGNRAGSGRSARVTDCHHEGA